MFLCLYFHKFLKSWPVKAIFLSFFMLSYCKTSKLVLITEWAANLLFVFSTLTFYGYLFKLSLMDLDQMCTVFDQKDLLQPRSFCIMPAKPFLLHTLPDIPFMSSKSQLWIHAWAQPPILKLTSLKRLVTKSYPQNHLVYWITKIDFNTPWFPPFFSQFKHYNYIILT